MIIITKDDKFETWAQLTDICNAHPEMSYHYLKGKKFNFTYKGYRFIKVKHKTKLI